MPPSEAVSTSPSLGLLELDKGMPLHGSQYLEHQSFFDLPPLPDHSHNPIYILKEPSVASSETVQVESPILEDIGNSISERLRKWLGKISQTVITEVSELNQGEMKKKKAAMDFQAKLNLRDEAHGRLPFFLVDGHPRVPIRAEDFRDLDKALASEHEDEMKKSTTVEGFDEEKDLQSDFLHISLEYRTDKKGIERKVILIRDLDTMEAQLES